MDKIIMNISDTMKKRLLCNDSGYCCKENYGEDCLIKIVCYMLNVNQ